MTNNQHHAIQLIYNNVGLVWACVKRPKGREQLFLTKKITLPKGFQDSVMEILNMVC